MRTKTRIALCMAALAGSMCSSASAQDLPQKAPPSELQLSFDEAVSRMEAGDHATACPALESVVQARPDGIGARLTLAECYEGWGKLASAWNQYVAAEAMAAKAGQEKRVKSAAAEAARLRPRLATLTLDVPAAMRAAQGLLIKLDDVILSEAQWGTPRPVDRGPHTVVVSATGCEPETLKADIPKDGVASTLTLPLLKRTSAPPPRTSQAPAEPAPRSKLPGFIGVGAGAAILVAGGALVGVAAGVGSDIDAKLPRDGGGSSLCRRTPQPGEDVLCADLRAQAESGSLTGNVGVGLLVGGGVVAAMSAVYLLLPSAKAPAAGNAGRLVPIAGDGVGGLVWIGSF